MRFNLENPTFEIVHPNLPDISVTVGRPDDLEKMEHFTSMGSFTVPTAVVHPQTGAVIYETIPGKDGEEDKQEVVTKDIPHFPVSSIANFIANKIVRWKGFQDSKGNEVPFSKSKVSLIFDHRLNLKKEDGTDGEPFWAYINGKILDEKTFDSDPLV